MSTLTVSKQFKQEATPGDGLSADDRERMRAAVAELAAALGQIDPAPLAHSDRARFERAWVASKTLTRLVDRTMIRTPFSAVPDTPETSGDLPDLTGHQVLLAVNDVAVQQAAGQMLTDLGARYQLATNGDAALGLLGATDFDMAVIDAELTGTAGADVIGAVRSRGATNGRMPVLALVPEAARGLRRSMREAGADAILATPFSGIVAFGGAIAGIVTGPVEGEQLPDRLVIDRERYERLMEIAGHEGAAELLERLLEDLRQVERGLERALAEQNPAEIRTQTHVLVALAGAVGADALQKIVETLNGAAHRRTVSGMTTLGRQTLRQLGHLIAFISDECAARR